MKQTTIEFVIEVVPWINCHDCAHQSQLPSSHEGSHQHQSFFYGIGVGSFNWTKLREAENNGTPVVYVKKDRNGNIIGKFNTQEEAEKIKRGEKI